MGRQRGMFRVLTLGGRLGGLRCQSDGVRANMGTCEPTVTWGASAVACQIIKG